MCWAGLKSGWLQQSFLKGGVLGSSSSLKETSDVNPSIHGNFLNSHQVEILAPLDLGNGDPKPITLPWGVKHPKIMGQLPLSNAMAPNPAVQQFEYPVELFQPDFQGKHRHLHRGIHVLVWIPHQTASAFCSKSQGRLTGFF